MAPESVRAIPTFEGVLKLGDQIIAVAPDDVYDAVRQLTSAMVGFQQEAARDPRTLTENPWEGRDSSAMWDAHDAFITLARRDLGVGHRPISNA
jgi:hypothetical protein